MSNLANMSPQAITAWQRLNELWGKPIPISSSYRDPETNKRVGGTKGSQHLHGNAFDIPTAGMSPQEIDALIKAGAKAGFRGFGGYDNSLHFDVGPQRTWGPSYGSDTTPEYLKSALSGAEFSPMNFSNPTMSTKGGGTMTPDQMTQEPEQPRGLLGNLFGNPDTMANLALAFNSMRLNPDPNLAAVLSAQMKERRQERKEKAQRNATADALDKIAPGAGDLVRAGIFSGSEALKFAKDKEKMALAQQASEAMANGDYKTAYALSLRLSPTAAGQAIAQQLGPRQSEVIAGGKYTTTYVDGQPVVTPNQAVIDAERQLLEQNREAERIRKGLPTTAQKAEEADFDALGAIDMIAAETARIERLFGLDKDTGEFKGPLQFGVGGLISGGLGSIGFGEANEKVARAREDYETFKTRLVNESLRLNKGVQTEGDAERAMKELGGAKTTAEAYAAIQKLQRINERARQLRERAIRTRRERYNLPDASIPQYAPAWEVVK